MMASPDPAEELEPQSDPAAWFSALFTEAHQSEAFDPARAALATVDAEGMPCVRFVLARQSDAGDFVFYTNYDSPKARQLAHTPHAALAYHWSSLGFQLRVRGTVSRLADEASDAYFASRPRGSQLAAWASRQSERLSDRAMLEAAVSMVEERFAQQQQVPRPAFWGGYCLTPASIEVWRTRDSRLHDRFLFTRAADGWARQRLQP